MANYVSIIKKILKEKNVDNCRKADEKTSAMMMRNLPIQIANNIVDFIEDMAEDEFISSFNDGTLELCLSASMPSFIVDDYNTGDPSYKTYSHRDRLFFQIYYNPRLARIIL